MKKILLLAIALVFTLKTFSQDLVYVFNTVEIFNKDLEKVTGSEEIGGAITFYPSAGKIMLKYWEKGNVRPTILTFNIKKARNVRNTVFLDVVSNNQTKVMIIAINEKGDYIRGVMLGESLLSSEMHAFTFR